MKIYELNSLVELFFKKLEEVDDNKPFLKWLNQISQRILGKIFLKEYLSLQIKSNQLFKKEIDVLILSENRPYWLMSDIAIMNAGGISVPIFTTYSADDYEFILKDCNPSIIIVSNNDQFKR